MEHFSKRRRVERSGEIPARLYGFGNRRGRSSSLTERKEKEGFAIPKLELPSHEDQAFATLLRFPRQKIQQLYDPLKSSEKGAGRLQTRGLVPTTGNTNIPAQVNSVVQPAAQPISTVANVAVSNGKDIVSSVVVPLAATPVAIPGFTELTMTPVATPSSSDNTPPTANKVDANPGDATPPAAVAASMARAEAIQTQQAMAHVYAALPPASTPMATPESRVAASQSSMAVIGPGSSQQVLSSPSTPIPSTPQSSNSPSSSYFSSSPTSAASSSSPASKSPTSSPTVMSHIPHRSSSSNSTTSITSLSASGVSAAMSMTSLNSEASAMSASMSVQVSASQASVNSMNALAALASASRIQTGFATSTTSSQSASSITSGQSTSVSTSLSASASSQLSQTSASGTSTSGIVAGGVGGPSKTGATSSPTSSSGAGSGGSSAPATPQLVGGIIGGVAGLAMILFFILILFRWRRRKMGQRRNISPPMPQTIGAGDVPQTGTMTQRSSTAPIAAAGFFGRLRPISSQTARTAATTDTAPSERGFQKISGRKLTSVLHSRGDGYDDPPAAAGSFTGATGPGDRDIATGQGPIAGLVPASRPSPPHSLSGSSFYRDSHGFYGGVVPANDQSQTTETSSSPSSPTYPAPLAAASQGFQGRGSPSSRQGEALNMRPGPARTPVINQPAQIPVRTPSRATPPGQPVRNTPPPIADFARIRDGLGRSHPSQDGSRGSRFREDTTPP